MRLLGEIAKIRAGFPFRGRVEPDVAGHHRVVQIKDVSDDGHVSFNGLLRTEVEGIKGEHFVRAGDVLFISRGTRRQAAAVNIDPGDVIASGQFFIIGRSPEVMPEFLAWYINRRPAQEYLTENAAGSNVQIITRPVLERLPIELPPLETQRRIVDVYKLSLEEQRLLTAIAERRARLVEETLLKEVRNHTIEGASCNVTARHRAE
jgi:restriction endonuclease S subunit